MISHLPCCLSLALPALVTTVAACCCRSALPRCIRPQTYLLTSFLFARVPERFCLDEGTCHLALDIRVLPGKGRSEFRFGRGSFFDFGGSRASGKPFMPFCARCFVKRLDAIGNRALRSSIASRSKPLAWVASVAMKVSDLFIYAAMTHLMVRRLAQQQAMTKRSGKPLWCSNAIPTTASIEICEIVGTSHNTSQRFGIRDSLFGYTVGTETKSIAKIRDTFRYPSASSAALTCRSRVFHAASRPSRSSR